MGGRGGKGEGRREEGWKWMRGERRKVIPPVSIPAYAPARISTSVLSNRTDNSAMNYGASVVITTGLWYSPVELIAREIVARPCHHFRTFLFSDPIYSFASNDPKNLGTHPERCFTKHKPHAGRRNHPRQRLNGPVCCCMTLFAASAFDSVVSCQGWQECTARFLFLVTLTFDLLPWHSNLFERGTKHVFPMNLAQIRLAVPNILDSQTKKNKRNKSHRQR